MDQKLPLGFIGQGWIGKNYADHFEERGFPVVRYALEEPYRNNKDAVATCDIIFIAVPTPTTPQGFDDSSIRSALSIPRKGSTVIIKSTIVPGLTERLVEEYPDLCIFHVPEFLREAHARHDVDHPDRLIIGPAKDTPEYRNRAEIIRSIHPQASHTRIVSSREAELIKYAHNALGYANVVFSNILYDLAAANGVAWEEIRDALASNAKYFERYISPVHKGGRGAGGNCFIKDFATTTLLYREHCPEDIEGNALLDAFTKKNNRLLRDSNKDLHLLRSVHGDVD